MAPSALILMNGLTCHPSVIPLGDVESTQVMLHIANDLQAQIMTKHNEGSLSLDGGVERLHWKLTVVTVTYLLSRRRNLDDGLYFTILVDFHARVICDHNNGTLLTEDCELVVTDISSKDVHAAGLLVTREGVVGPIKGVHVRSSEDHGRACREQELSSKERSLVALKELRHRSRILKKIGYTVKSRHFNLFQSSPSSAILVPFCFRNGK